ncbi:hypothetical protein UA75_29050 [Actinoalloteichus sp. GBA129-24]|uniref:Uncharacterized protein n=1 Tax=Actinoalloteichus fjordicus TaxID=1612552 RepID=A0AAC9LGY5_9PSEU|nr:hypothetical protein UA74_28520 [Actinoalloteichus fjordicus]APU23781.1 hypothetical protein UA75_29050 [Actinoalloteichus sp. GBA129-24]
MRPASLPESRPAAEVRARGRPTITGRVRRESGPSSGRCSTPTAAWLGSRSRSRRIRNSGPSRSAALHTASAAAAGLGNAA